MVHWYEFAREEFRTLSTSVPKDLVPEIHKARGSLSTSKYIRRLIEADIESKDNEPEPSAA